MLRGNRLYVFALGLVFTVFAIISWRLLPQPPQFSEHRELKAQEGTYKPGGSRCEPKTLAELTGDEALRERDRCADAKEQHRLDTEDLIQQTRSADGTQAGAWIDYQGLLVAYLGTLFSFGTLLTAIAAVYFAKRAADAADKGVKLALDTSQAELRAYLGPISETIELDNEAKTSGMVVIKLTNRGVTPAKSTVFDANVVIEHRNGGIDQLRQLHWPMGTLVRDDPIHFDIEFKIDDEANKAIRARKAAWVARLTARYQDAFGKFWLYEHVVEVDADGIDKKVVRTRVCRQYEIEEEPHQDSAEAPFLPFVPRQS